MKNVVRKLILTIGFIILVLICTNPSNSDFDYYIHAKGFDSSIHGGRVKYFLIFSTFEVKFKYGTDHEDKSRYLEYLGVFNNFIILKDEK